MRKTRLLRVAGLCTAVLCVTSLAAAAEHPAEAFPDDVGVVIRLKQPQQTSGRISEFAKNVDPALAPQAQQLGPAAGMLISNPAQLGVDRAGDWWAAVFIEAEGQPKVVFAIPTTDADAMQQAVGEQFHFATYENWALYSQDEAVIGRIQERISGTGQSIAEGVNERSLDAFQAGDLSLYVNVDHLAETFSEKLDAADAQIDQLVDQIASMTPPTAGVNMEAMWEMYGKLGHGLIRAIRGTESLTVSLAFDPQNVLIEEFIVVKEDSSAAEFLAKHPVSPLELLGKLPADKLVYYGFHGDMPGLMKFGMEMSREMLESENEDATRALDAMLEEYSKLEFGDMAGTVSLGELEKGVIQSANVLEVKPADKMRKMVREMLPALSNVELQGFKQEITVEQDAEKFGEHSADLLTTKQEVDPNVDPTGMQQKMAEIMYGPEGLVSRYVFTDGKMIQTVGNGREGMEEALKALDVIEGDEETAGGSEAWKAARAQVSSDANLVALLDLPQIAVQVASLVAESGEFPVPFTAESLDDLEIQPSFIGFSIATDEQALRCRTTIPALQVQGIYELVKFFQQMNQRGRL